MKEQLAALIGEGWFISMKIVDKEISVRIAKDHPKVVLQFAGDDLEALVDRCFEASECAL